MAPNTTHTGPATKEAPGHGLSGERSDGTGSLLVGLSLGGGGTVPARSPIGFGRRSGRPELLGLRRAQSGVVNRTRTAQRRRGCGLCDRADLRDRAGYGHTHHPRRTVPRLQSALESRSGKQRPGGLARNNRCLRLMGSSLFDLVRRTFLPLNARPRQSSTPPASSGIRGKTVPCSPTHAAEDSSMRTRSTTSTARRVLRYQRSGVDAAAGARAAARIRTG